VWGFFVFGTEGLRSDPEVDFVWRFGLDVGIDAAQIRVDRVWCVEVL